MVSLRAADANIDLCTGDALKQNGVEIYSLRSKLRSRALSKCEYHGDPNTRVDYWNANLAPTTTERVTPCASGGGVQLAALSR